MADSKLEIHNFRTLILLRASTQISRAFRARRLRPNFEKHCAKLLLKAMSECKETVEAYEAGERKFCRILESAGWMAVKGAAAASQGRVHGAQAASRCSNVQA